MRPPKRHTIFNGPNAAGRLAAANGRAILPGAWTVAALLTAAGCSPVVGPDLAADVACAAVTANHSGVLECHVGTSPAVADMVGPDRIETRSHLDL